MRNVPRPILQCPWLQVQLLISAQDVENYKLIKADLDRLRTLVEKSELWVEKKGSGGGDGKKDKKDKKEKGEVRSQKVVVLSSVLNVGGACEEGTCGLKHPVFRCLNDVKMKPPPAFVKVPHIQNRKQII